MRARLPIMRSGSCHSSGMLPRGTASATPNSGGSHILSKFRSFRARWRASPRYDHRSDLVLSVAPDTDEVHMLLRALFITILLVFPLPSSGQSATRRLPILDMHLHAATLEEFGGGGPACVNEGRIVFKGWDPKFPLTPDRLGTCESTVPSPTTDGAVMRETLAMLERYNIWAVTTGPLERVATWRAAGSQRIIPALAFTDRERMPTEYRQLHAAGAFAVFGEITAQYRGLTLDDLSYDPYFALAEQLDVPVGVHLGEGPPGGAHLLGGGGPPSAYRVRLGSPLQLEEVLIRHPKLRVYVMHYGSPFVDEMIAMLYSHPQIYVDIAQNNWGFPRDHFYAQLKRLVDAGFEERILFGSDQMIWPRTIEVAIRTVEGAPFLSEKQKRDILYNNGARFLRLSEAEIARHHGR